jgi:hypothetical protein
MVGKSKRAIEIEKRREELRNQIWPDLDKSKLWNRNSFKGFISIPRTLPLIGKILNEVSEQGRLSDTYYTLWTYNNDQNFIEITNPVEVSFSTGFTGQRALQTWTNKMRELTRLGFISVKDGASGEFNFVLIWEPHIIILEHEQKKTRGLASVSITALKARLNKIGAKPFEINRD